MLREKEWGKLYSQTRFVHSLFVYIGVSCVFVCVARWAASIFHSTYQHNDVFFIRAAPGAAAAPHQDPADAQHVRRGGRRHRLRGACLRVCVCRHGPRCDGAAMARGD